MRRAQTDNGSQIVRNFAYNPSFEATGTNVALRTNTVINPSMENTGSATVTRTNLFTNPSAETASGTVNVRTNLTTNPSMEATSSTVNVRTNMAPNPSFETALSTTDVRRNLILNPLGRIAGNLNIGPNNTVVNNSTGAVVTHTNGASAGNAYYAAECSLTSGATYYVRAVIEDVTGTPSVNMSVHSTIGSPMGTVATGTRVGNIVYREWSFTATASGLARLLLDYVGTGTGESYRVREMIVSEAPIKSFFDGDAPIVNLHPNPSLEVNNAAWNSWAGSTGSVTGARNASIGGYVGSASYRVVWNTSQTSPGSGGAFTDAPIMPGMTYSASAMVRVSKNQTMRLSIEWVNAAKDATVGSTVLGAETVVSAGAWCRIKNENIVAPAGAAYLRVTTYASFFGSAWLVGDTLDVDAVMVERSPFAGSYYEGTGDFTYVWTGTPNASLSVQRGTAVDGAGSNNQTAVIQSTDWAHAGTKSVRLIPIRTSADTYTAVGGDVGGLRLGMVAGSTYTASVYCRVRTTRSVGSTGRNIRAYWPDGLGGYTTVQSSNVPNAPGIYRISLTFTIPAGKTEAFIRLYHATDALGADDDVWYDGFLLEETPILQPYFDAATPIVNAVSNPDLATDLTGWASGGTLTRTFEGGRWWAVIPAGTYGYAPVTTRVGAHYAASLRVRGPVGTSVSIISTDNVIGGFLSSSAQTIPASGELYIQAMSGTNPAQGTGSFVGVAAGAASLKITEVYVERAEGAGKLPVYPYFKGQGDFTYAWSGTANASLSYQQAPEVAGITYSGGESRPYQSNLSYIGTKSLKIKGLATDTTGITFAGPTVSSLTVGNTYTVSAYVYAVSGSAPLEVQVSGLAPVATGKTTTTDVWERIYHTFVANATSHVFRFRNAAAGAVNAYVDAVLIEQSPALGTYFDGATPIQNIISNPSFETDTTGWVTGAVGSRDTSKAYEGSASLKVNTVSSPPYTGVAWNPSGIVVGQTYTWSAYIWAPTGTTVNFAADGMGTNTAISGNNSWQRVSLTGQYSGSGTFYIRSTVTNQAAFWVDAVLLERHSALNPYYSGTGDFTYLWAGTANASVSYQQASGVTSIGTSNTYSISSRDWPMTGSKSVRVIPNSTSNDSFASLGGVTLATGKTYTLSATIRMTGALTGTLNSSARQIRVYHSNASAISTTAPNVAGSTRLSVSFTVTDGAVYQSLRLYNGASFGGGDVWWDDIILEEGITNGSYFDGANPLQNLITNSSFETNTTGWLSDTGSPTLTSDSTMAWVGTKSLKAVSTTVSPDVAAFTAATLLPNATYTISWYVYSLAARTAHVDISGNPSYNLSTQGLKVVPANTWTRVSATFNTPAALSGTVTFYLHHAGGPNSSGNTIYIDGVLLERSPALGPYYDGLGDFTYAWTGTANASTSEQRSVLVADRQVVNSTCVMYQSTVRANIGTKSGAVRTKSDILMDATLMYPASDYSTSTGIAAGVSNTWSMWVWVPSGSGTVRLVDVTTGTTGAANTLFDQWERLSVTFTGLTSGAHALRLRAFTTVPAGTTIWWDNELLEAANALRPYFDGSTVLTDFTYQWNGTANNSTSTQRANWASDAAVSGTAFVIQSSDWASSGSKSVRCITASAGEPEIGLNTSRMQFGKTYTVLAKLRINKVAIGSTSRARRINFYHSNNNQQSFFTQVGTTSPNAVGVYEHRLVITIPADTTHIYLRLGGHSSVAFDADAWWDDVMIIEGNYTGDYVDGTKTLAKWDGTANSAVSVGYPPQLLDISGRPDVDVSVVGTIALPGGYDSAEARTIYTVWQSISKVPVGQIDGIVHYGSSDRSDIVPNIYTTLRVQASGSTGNGVLARRTGGGGPIEGNGPAFSTHVTCWGMRTNSTLFLRDNGGTEYFDAALAMAMPHQELVVLSDSVNKKHVRTLVYRGEHSPETKLAISRYLGNKYGANIA